MKALLVALLFCAPAHAESLCADRPQAVRLITERSLRDPIGTSDLFRSIYLAEKPNLGLSPALAAYFDENYLQAPEIARAQAAARRRDYEPFMAVFKRYMKPGVLTDEQLRKVIERDVQGAVETLGEHYLAQLNWLARELSPEERARRRPIFERLERLGCLRIPSQPPL